MRFRGLQNYTTLKPQRSFEVLLAGFRGLQNYTTLKLSEYSALRIQGF